MRSIVIADSLYHRYVGLSHTFSREFDVDPSVDIFDSYNAKKIARKGCYKNALVIGNHSTSEMEKINQLLLRNNSEIVIYRILFSDVIKLRNLKRHLIISPYCIVVSGDISSEELLALSQSWLSSLDKDCCVSVRFNQHEKRLFRRWEYAVYGDISPENSKLDDADYSISSRLKRKMSIRSEYSLYLLWRIACAGCFYMNNYTRMMDGKVFFPRVSLGKLPESSSRMAHCLTSAG